MTRLLIAAGLLALAAACPRIAAGAITCTFSSPGFTAAYVPSTGTTNVTQSSVTVTCQRNAGGDATSIAYNIAADNGLNSSGQQNRARLAATANYILYDTFRDSGCSQDWRANAPNRLGGTITGMSGFIPVSQTLSWWGCIPASQLGLAAGNYSDTVTMTLSYGASSPTATFPVAIYTPASCTITTAPGTVSFTYTAFGGAQNASTPFAVTCSNVLPYTMALGATSGVIVGLQYTIALSAAGGVGTGASQSYSVNGTMPAGQAGTCGAASCAGTQVQTLTITY
ncbi:MAG TPA: spore coat protein U domain-containing protein [Usitatibacter sp.]|nr:spore coat protein U domain-containing protein [Usitatibacter sp.]